MTDIGARTPEAYHYHCHPHHSYLPSLRHRTRYTTPPSLSALVILLPSYLPSLRRLRHCDLSTELGTVPPFPLNF